MDGKRRTFLKTSTAIATTAGAGSLGGFPYFFMKDAEAQSTPWVKKGDKIQAVFSGSAPGLGLIYKKPGGEPAVPSVIFSAWKVD